MAEVPTSEKANLSMEQAEPGIAKENEAFEVGEIYRVLVENLKDAIVVLDLKGDLLFVNRAAEELTGYTREEMIGHHAREIIPEQFRSLCGKMDKMALGGRPVPYFEVEIRKKDGTIVPVETGGQVIRKGNEIAGILIIVRDIGERKRTEKTLRESEEKYRSLVDNASTSIAVTDLEGRLTYVNTALANLLGYSTQEMLGRHWKTLLHPDDRERTLSQFRNVMATQGHYENVEFRTVQKDGSVLHLMSRPTKYRLNGKTVGFQAIIVDITSQKKNELAIRESQQKFQRLFMNIPEAAIYWDSDFCVLDVNPRFTELFGYTLDEIRGKDSTSFLVPESSLTESDLLGRRAKKGGVNEDAVRRRKDGSLVPVSISVAPIVVDGCLTGLVGLYRDMTQHKKADEALRHSEEKYRNLVENTRDSIVTTDLNGNVLFYNRATEELTGYDSASDAPSNVREITPLKYWPKSLAMLLKARRGKPIPYFESAIRRKDGKLVPVESGGQAIFKNGKAVGIQIITRDISERKTAESALRQSEERFRGLFESAQDIIVTLDLQSRITAVNSSVRRYGYSAKQLVGKSIFTLIPKSEWTERKRNLLELAKGQSTESTFRIEVKGRSAYVVVEARSNPIVHDGSVVGIQTIMRDITERKEMEGRLRDSEEEFRAITSSASDAILLVDEKGNLSYWNPAVVNMFGYTEEELCSRPLYELIAPERFHKNQLDGFNRYQKTGKGRLIGKTVEMQVTRKDGTEFPVEFSLSALLVRGRRYALGIVRDITERKGMEEELKRYAEHLEEMVKERTRQLRDAQEQLIRTERMAAVGGLATTVAHDLRNPLTAIRNASFYIKNECRHREDPKCKTAREMLDLVEQETSCANDIINDLLDLVAKKPLRKERQTMHTMLESFLRRVSIPENIEVERRFVEKAYAYVDKKQLERVFLNVIENAVQAMPNGGKLGISATQTEESIIMEFIDTGTGIEPKNLDKIFNPFFTTKAKGIGLGLAICKRIVEEHGGTISVKSAPGKGATFIVVLPKGQEEKKW